MSLFFLFFCFCFFGSAHPPLTDPIFIFFHISCIKIFTFLHFTFLQFYIVCMYVLDIRLKCDFYKFDFAACYCLIIIKIIIIIIITMIIMIVMTIIILILIAEVELHVSSKVSSVQIGQHVCTCCWRACSIVQHR